MKRTVLGEFIQHNKDIVESKDDRMGRVSTSTNISFEQVQVLYNSPSNNENSFSEMHSQSFLSLRRQDPTPIYKTPNQVKIVRRRTTYDGDDDYFAKYRIPDHVILQIFSYLNKKDLVNAMRTCKRFSNVSYDKNLWSFFNGANKHATELQLHSLLDRKTKVLRLTNATVSESVQQFGIKSASIQQFIRHAIKPSHLTHLDLSHAKFERIESLVYLLGRCSSLECLSLESCEVNDSACIEIAKNSKLRCLNMIMTTGLLPRGLNAITSQCIRLIELNLGWAHLSPDAIRSFVRTAPVTLQRLNLSGTCDNPAMNDGAVQLLCHRCPQLLELDLSDNSVLTERSIRTFRELPHLQKLTLGRCYGIEPVSFLSLHNLQELNIMNCVTDEGIALLRERLAPTRINDSVFSTIAISSVNENTTRIWGMRTRDLY